MSTTPTSRQLPRGLVPGVLAALVAYLALVSVPPVLSRPAWGDEIRTWRDSVQSDYPTLLSWRHNPRHAPLGHLLARASADAFGTDAAWALRLPSLLAALACVPAVWLLGRTIAGDGVGLVAAALAAIDLNLVWQSQQARMYTLLLLFVVLSMTASVCSWRLTVSAAPPARRWRAWALAGAALGAALWAHYAAYGLVLAMVTTGAIAAVVGVVTGNRRTGATLLAGLLLAVAIAAAVAVQGVLPGKIAIMGDRPGKPLRTPVIRQLVTAGGEMVGSKAQVWGALVATAAGLVLLGGGAVTRGRRAEEVGPGPDARATGPLSAAAGAAVLLAATAVWVIATVAVMGRARPIEGARYFTVMQPAYWTAAAVAFVWAWRLAASPGAAGLRRAVRALAVVALAGHLAFHAWRSAHAEDHCYGSYRRRYAFAQAVDTIVAARQPGDAVLYVPWQRNELFASYYRLLPDESLRKSLEPLVGVGGRRRATPPTTRPSPAIAPLPPRLWVVVLNRAPVARDKTDEANVDDALHVLAGAYGARPVAMSPRPGPVDGYWVARFEPGRVDLLSPAGGPVGVTNGSDSAEATESADD